MRSRKIAVTKRRGLFGRDWRWTAIDVVLAGLGGWLVFDQVGWFSLTVFVVANLACAAAFFSKMGRDWVHPTPWDLPVILVGNLLILLAPLLIPTIMAAPLRMTAALTAMIGARILIAVASARHERMGIRGTPRGRSEEGPARHSV
jgi:hypothetical protein